VVKKFGLERGRKSERKFSKSERIFSMSGRDSARQACKTDATWSIARLFLPRRIAAKAIQEAVTENDLKIVGDAVGKSRLNRSRPGAPRTSLPSAVR
jgi:hypothetical protein